MKNAMGTLGYMEWVVRGQEESFHKHIKMWVNGKWRNNKRGYLWIWHSVNSKICHRRKQQEKQQHLLINISIGADGHGEEVIKCNDTTLSSSGPKNRFSKRKKFRC